MLKTGFRQNMHDCLRLMQKKLFHGVLAEWLLMELEMQLHGRKPSE